MVTNKAINEAVKAFAKGCSILWKSQLSADPDFLTQILKEMGS